MWKCFFYFLRAEQIRVYIYVEEGTSKRAKWKKQCREGEYKWIKVGSSGGSRVWGKRSGLTRGTLLPLKPLGGTKNGVLYVKGALLPWLVFSL